ncbi:MAG: outer membrane beta-barrel protein [Legionellaceae bacterium]|nr:outer membrane beta-barrel protein [Legionellaceae bacterium]
MDAKKTTYKLGLISLLISCPTINAGSIGNQSFYPEGLSLIAGAGLTEFMNIGTYKTISGDMTNTYSSRAFQSGFVGDLALGYGISIKKPFYLGAELGVGFFGNTKNHSSSSSTDSTVVTDHDFSRIALINNSISTQTSVSENPIVPYFDLKPGVVVANNTWIFGRVGVNYNEIKVKTSSQYNSSGGIITTPQLPLSTHDSYFTFNSKTTLAGIRTGLGMEYLLNDKLAISANYIYAFYNTVKTSGSNNSKQISCDTLEGCVAVNGPFTSTGSSKASDQQVLLELIYHLT